MNLIATLSVFVVSTTLLPEDTIPLTDNLGWAGLACYGSKFYETPHIDRLAAAIKRPNAHRQF